MCCLTQDNMEYIYNFISTLDNLSFPNPFLAFLAELECQKQMFY